MLSSTKTAILAREGYRCAGCGSKTYSLEDAHLFGRGQLGQPWEDLPECRIGLCTSDPKDGHFGCHQLVDRAIDIELRDRLRTAACERLAKYLEAQGGDSRGATVGTWGDPMQTARELVRRLEALSVEAER